MCLVSITGWSTYGPDWGGLYIVLSGAAVLITAILGRGPVEQLIMPVPTLLETGVRDPAFRKPTCVFLVSMVGFRGSIPTGVSTVGGVVVVAGRNPGCICPTVVVATGAGVRPRPVIFRRCLAIAATVATSSSTRRSFRLLTGTPSSKPPES